MASAATYGECPSVGANTGCAILITIGSSGTPVVAQDTSQGPYDGSDDTLVGVLNNSSSTVFSLPLSSSTSSPPIFGFEGDGMCFASPSPTGNCSNSAALNQSNPDPYDYGGDFVTFSNIDSTTQNSGTVNFTGGLAPGASAYFSLENDLSASDITSGPPSTTPGSSVPEPSTYGLMASGIAACGLWLKRRRSTTAK